MHLESVPHRSFAVAENAYIQVGGGGQSCVISCVIFLHIKLRCIFLSYPFLFCFLLFVFFLGFLLFGLFFCLFVNVGKTSIYIFELLSILRRLS